MTIESYRDLHVWQAALELAHSVYRITRELPRPETYGMTAQFRRGATPWRGGKLGLTVRALHPGSVARRARLGGRASWRAAARRGGGLAARLARRLALPSTGGRSKIQHGARPVAPGQERLRTAPVTPIPSRIAEGHASEEPRDDLSRLSEAQAVLADLETQWFLAGRLGYLQAEPVERTIQQTESLAKQLCSLRNALRSVD